MSAQRQLFASLPTSAASATFSECGRYRYHLSRAWGDPTRRVLFCLLNPSIADATRPDATLRRCIGFAKSWGFGALDVVNLFAWVSTDPDGLLDAEDPVGPLNDAAIVRTARGASIVVAGWGANATRLGQTERARRVMALLADRRVTNGGLHAFAWTGDNEPAHPLRLRKTLKPQPITAHAGHETWVAETLRRLG